MFYVILGMTEQAVRLVTLLGIQGLRRRRRHREGEKTKSEL